MSFVPSAAWQQSGRDGEILVPYLMAKGQLLSASMQHFIHRQLESNMIQCTGFKRPVSWDTYWLQWVLQEQVEADSRGELQLMHSVFGPADT